MIVGHCVASPHLNQSRHPSPIRELHLIRMTNCMLPPQPCIHTILSSLRRGSDLDHPLSTTKGRKLKELRGHREIGFLIASRLSTRKTILSSINLARLLNRTQAHSLVPTSLTKQRFSARLRRPESPRINIVRYIHS